MTAKGSKLAMMVAGGTIAAALMLACGGGGGGGGGSTIQGSVGSASTTGLVRERKTWLVWLREEVVGLARRAYAQANTSRGGIAVTVTGESGGPASTTTDDSGGFKAGGAPTGDVTVTFSRGKCSAPVDLDEVINNSTLALTNTMIDCNSATVGELDETFAGVLRNKPASQQGNLNVCAFGGKRNHTRAVSTDASTKFVDANGTSIDPTATNEGDFIEVTGTRRGIGGNSTVDATRIKRLGSGNNDQCKNLVTPTPVPTSAPTATPTP